LKAQIKRRGILPPSVVEVASAASARKTTSRNYFLPDSAFRRDVTRAKQQRARIEQQCRSQNKTFVDSDFRPNVRALIGKYGGKGLKSARKLATRVTQWLRPSQMRSSTTGYVPRESEWVCSGIVFFFLLSYSRTHLTSTTQSVFRGDPKASDVSQGELGDCWFLSSLAVLSAYPELVKRLLVTTARSQCGVYCVRLCVGGQWKLFFVDDYFPCDSNGFPVFLQPQRQTLWPLLIEKAFAKMHGAYAAIDGGRTEEALAILTGLPCKTVDDIHKAESITSTKLFQVLVGWHKLGFICTASCGHTNRAQGDYKRMGLQPAHAYTILGVAQVNGSQLVKLRNPWGSGEWRGRWSDNDRTRWTPSARKMCNFKPNSKDGVFWMCVEDLRQFFNSVTTCKLRRNWHQMRWPLVFPPSIDAPPVEAYSMTTGPRGGLHIECAAFQHSGRGRSPDDKYFRADQMCFIFSVPPNASGSIDASNLSLVSSSVSESLNVMSCCEAVLKPNTRYVVVPFVFTPRALGISRTHKSTMVLYSSHRVTPSKITINPTAVVFVLRAYLKMHGKKKDSEFPVDVYAMNGCILVENRSPDCSTSFWFEMSNVKGLLSSRHEGCDKWTQDNVVLRKVESRDTIPPRSFQIVSWWAPWSGNWKYQSSWSIKFGSPKTIGSYHDPPLPLTTGGIHSVYRIP